MPNNIQNKREKITYKEYSILNFLMKEIKDKFQENLLALIQESKHLRDEIHISYK